MSGHQAEPGLQVANGSPATGEGAFSPKEKQQHKMGVLLPPGLLLPALSPSLSLTLLFLIHHEGIKGPGVDIQKENL